MARPKSTKPIKQKLSLTVSAQTRAELEFIAIAHKTSISALVAEFAEKEARKIAKSTGKETPDVEQISMDDLETTTTTTSGEA